MRQRINATLVTLASAAYVVGDDGRGGAERVKRVDVTSLTQVEDGPENSEEAPAADGDEG